MKTTISVIVPAWNEEQFIARCLDSIKSQNFENFNVYIIDNGSYDETPKIAQRYCNQDRRFELIITGRLSPGEARNLGVIQSESDFVSFCDADDTMKPDMLESLYTQAQEKMADIVVADFDMIYPERRIENFSNLDNYSGTITDDIFADYYFKYCAAPKPNNSLWARLYRRSFLEKSAVKITTSKYSEDHLFNASLLTRQPHICHVQKSVYNYIQSQQSTTRKNAREFNHGEIFLSAFKEFQKTLEEINRIYTEPVLSIYAYTRIKSILFYAWQAGLDENKIKAACDIFIKSQDVRRYLELCLEKGYIDKYCDIHGFSQSWRSTVKEMLIACLEGTELPDMKEIFI